MDLEEEPMTVPPSILARLGLLDRRDVGAEEWARRAA
jgi:hypothetical protein